MRKDGVGQRMARLTLVEPSLAFHSQVGVLDPIEHEERALDAADFTEGKIQPILLAAGSQLPCFQRTALRPLWGVRRIQGKLLRKTSA